MKRLPLASEPGDGSSGGGGVPGGAVPAPAGAPAPRATFRGLLGFLTSWTVRKHLRITNVRVASQIFFFAAFIFFCWATWTSRLGMMPGSDQPVTMSSTSEQLYTKACAVSL